MSIAFDWSVNLGHVLTIIAFIGTGLGFAFGMRADVRMMQRAEIGVGERLKAVESQIRQMTEVVVALARQDERLHSQQGQITRLDERVDSLERGK
jgi:TolA-binding protein